MKILKFADEELETIKTWLEYLDYIKFWEMNYEKAEFYGISKRELDRMGKDEEAREHLVKAIEAAEREPIPCPWCKERPHKIYGVTDDDFRISCENGACPVNPSTERYELESDAIEAWNSYDR